MGHFRDQMEQAMVVRGFSPVTQYTYAYWMRRFVAFFRRPPIELGLDEINAFQHVLAKDEVFFSAFNQCVYSKPSFVGPEHVIRYLGRYTHRIAITNGRLVAHERGEPSPWIRACIAAAAIATCRHLAASKTNSANG